MFIRIPHAPLALSISGNRQKKTKTKKKKNGEKSTTKSEVLKYATIYVKDHRRNLFFHECIRHFKYILLA